jgi:outer membrane usher protein
VKPGVLFVLINLTLFGTSACAQSGLRFNPAFLNGEHENNADLSWLLAGLDFPPGDYDVTVFINENYAFTGKVLFKMNEQQGEKQLTPCITPEQLAATGIDVNQAPEAASSGPQRCYVLSRFFPGITFNFDQNNLTLRFTVPQRYIKKLPRGYTSPELWEDGITAAWLNYVANGSHNVSRGTRRTRQNRIFTSLNSGINFGPWRFRDYSTWTSSNGKSQLTHIRSWLQRDVPAIQSQIWLGETYTSSQIFDAAGLRGLALSSDDNMLPASLRGYAPEVRGIANSNAIVTVHQNGNIVYQISVPPGEFILRDLYPASSGEDLLVTIKEEDGSEKRYSIPFSSNPNLVRAGQLKYSLALGRYRPTTNQSDPLFFHGEAFYGWRHGLTFFGGTQISPQYTGLALGVGQNMGRLGAFSLDATHSISQLPNGNTYNGNAIRLRYNKLIYQAGTRINFYSWRFSTKGFYTLNDTTYKKMAGSGNTLTDNNNNESIYYQNNVNLSLTRKAKNQVLLSHPLQRFGTLSLSWEKQTYWHTDKSTEGIQFAWHNTLQNITWGINYQQSTMLFDSKKDNIIALSLSVALGKPTNLTRLRYSHTHSTSSGNTHSAGLSGHLPEQNNLTYNLNQRYNARREYGGDIAMQYRGTTGDYYLSYGYSPHSRQYNYGVSGGAVLHADGVTLSQPLGNTNILIKAPGAAHVSIRNYRGIKTDGRGYAVIPYATPYQLNRVEMDITTAGHEVEINNAIVNKAPTEGALVRATIPVRVGMKAMFILRHQNGVLPFGSIVTLQNEKPNSGIVGDGGSLYLSGLPLQGKLLAVWGQDTDKSCTAEYQLSKSYYRTVTGLYSQELICR